MEEAFRAFLIDNPNAFEMVYTLDESKKAVRFLQERMSPSAVVVRIFHSQFAEKLIEQMIEERKGTPALLLFLQQIIYHIPEHVWVEKELGALYVGFVDECAVLKIRYFFVKKDFRRAWDEIKKFRKQAGNEGGNNDSLRMVVQELFALMAKANLVTPITDSDCVAQDYKSSFVAYDTKPRARDTRPTVQRMLVKRPGWDIACELGVMDNINKRWLKDITLEGAMVLKIASYFREKRSDQRKQKHLKVLAEYDLTHQKK